jgi:hypothetical protein
MSNQSDYQAGYAAAAKQSQRIKNVGKLTAEQMDDVLEKTEYAETGVAIGQSAVDDQDYRRAAQKELARRMGHE